MADEIPMITLPDGTRLERFLMDGRIKRELVLVQSNNEQGCRLTYRDAMTAEDVEFTVPATVDVQPAKAVKPKSKRRQ